MKQTCLALAVIALGTGLASSAKAQARDDSRFGDAGQLAISAERMFGAMFIWNNVEGGGVDETTTDFHVSAISNPLANVTTNYSFPRMGLDFFIIDGDLTYYLIPVAAVGGLQAVHLSAYAQHRVFRMDGVTGPAVVPRPDP